MLLYHFPLTSSSATANLTNKGIKQDYILRNNVVFEIGGKLSSYALRTKANNDGLQIEIPTFTTEYTLCLRISIFSNQYLCEINNEQIASSYVGITNSWCDVVIMKNKLYVDKVYKRDLTYSNGKLLIGGLFSNGGTCNCLIQDIRIYDYALSQAEINEYSRALVVHYPLQGNELNPSVLKDVSGFGNDATLNRGYALGYKGESTRGEKCIYNEDKNNNYRYSVANFYPPKQLSMAMWFKVNCNATDVGPLIFFRNSKNGMYWNGVNKNLYGYIEATTTSGSWITNLNDNKWHHIVFTFVETNNAITAKAYKDGELHRSLTLNYATAWTAQTINFSHGQGDAYDVKFAMCDFRVYATALSAEDIKNLYNSPISVSKQHQTMAFEFVEGNDGFSAKKNGIVQHNELIEGSADGCYQDKLITNKLIEQ